MVIFIFMVSTTAAKACPIDAFITSVQKEGIKVNSAHRSKEHNKKVGGAKNSFHLLACGARDIQKSSIHNVKEFIRLALLAKYRIIEYKNHIHIDTGESKYLKGTYNNGR